MEENQVEKKSYKGFIIGSIISFVITGLIMGIVLLIGYTSRGEHTKELVIWVDGLTLSGFIMVLFYLLNLLTREGAFDILAYSIKLVWFNTFYRNVRETKLPKSYREYRELKAAQAKDSNLFLIVGASPYIIAGIILYIIYLIH